MVEKLGKKLRKVLETAGDISMKLSIERKVFEALPGMKLVVVVARDVDNQLDRPDLRSVLVEAWALAGKAATEYGNPQSHPRIKTWVDHFKALGVSRKAFPSSLEAMVRRVGKGGEPISINPLVDFYNAVSLKYMVTAGGYDLDQLDQGLALRFSRSGDTFQALDEDRSSEIPEGEVSYADGDQILTRHMLWRQSKKGLLERTSRNVVLVSEIPGEFEEGTSEHILSVLMNGIREHFQVEPNGYIMDAEHIFLVI